MSSSNPRHRGHRDQAARAALAPLVAAGRAVCPRCGQLIAPNAEWDAGHVVSLLDGGSPSGPRVPEHAACNRSAGATAGNRRRGGRSRLTSWLTGPAPP